MKRTTLTIAFLLLATGGLDSAYCADQASENPGIYQTVTTQEIDKLKQQIVDESRPNLEFIFDYHTESGDLNDRLDFWRYGARLNYKFRSSALLYFSAIQTPYKTKDSVLDEWGTNFTVGIKGRVSERVQSQVEVGGTRLSTGKTTVNASGSVRFSASEKTNFYATASRSNVEESLLSATGIRPVAGPFTGQLVGAVMDNRVIVGGSHGLPWKLDLFAEGGVGNRAGENVDSNFFRTAGGGIGCNIVATADDQPLNLLRFSYSLNYFGFDENRLGYGGVSLLDQDGQPIPIASLGSDDIPPDPSDSNPGVGGYFSPQRFLSNTFRADLRGRPDKAFEYRFSGFVGGQSYTGTSTRQAHGFSGSLIFHMGDRFSLPVTYIADNFGPFTQRTLLVRLVVKF